MDRGVMRFGLLGTLEVIDHAGAPLDLGGAQPRTLLAMLLAASGRVVSLDAVVDTLWGENAPESAAGTIQSYVSRLRRSLEPDRAPREAPRLLVWDPPGYRLAVAADDVDFRRFEALADAGRDLLDRGQPEEARRVLLDADALWRGPALLEQLDHEFARGVARRLEERRLAALDDRIDAELRLGRHGALAGELRELVERHPLREGLHAHLALALYRSGRQSEALRALDAARCTLRDELGVEPGRALRELERQILAQDVALDLPRATASVAAPSDAAPVVSATPVASMPAPHAGPVSIVGRKLEIDQLVKALDDTADVARFALVEGEPGIGKTSLVEALCEIAATRGALTVWGRCHEGDAAPALWPWIAALRTLLAELPTATNPTVAQLLAPTGDGQLATSPFELFDGVARVLGAVAAQRCVVVVIDDLQWADQTSLELLTFLAGRLTDTPVLVVGTVRELDIGRNDELVAALAAMTRRAGSTRVVLRGLDPVDTGLLLDRVTGRSVPIGVATAIHRRAEGNPFFATELARLVVDASTIDDAEAIVDVNVPAGVRDVVRRRLARLPDDTNELLQVGAVIGRDIELQLLTLASGRAVEECLDAIEPALVQRLLVMDPEQPTVVRFAHALVREVLDDGITSLRRARLHLRVADAIEATSGDADDAAEILAEHLWAAAPVGAGQRAAEALERAAEVAVRRVALQSAQHLLTRAAQLRHAVAETPESLLAELLVVARLNAVVRARTGFASSADTYRRGQELARRVGRTDILHEMMWVEWGAADTACDFTTGRPLADYFHELIGRTDDPFERMLGLSVWGIQCWHEGRITEASEYLDAAAAMASWQPDDRVLHFYAEQRMFNAGFALHVHDLAGDMDDVDERFSELARRQPDRFSASIIWTQAISSAIARGDWDRAMRYGRHGVEADPEAVFTFWGSAIQMCMGCALLHVGKPDEGWPLFLEGRQRYLAGGTRTALGHYLASAGMGLLRNGRIDEAASIIAEARQEATVYGEKWPEPVILLAEAELAIATGNPAGGVELLARARTTAASQGSNGIARRIEARACELGLSV